MAALDKEQRLDRGTELCKEKDYDEALKAFKAVLKEEPGNAHAAYGAGYCFYKLGHPERSEAFLQAALDKGHINAAPMLRHVRTLLAARRPDPAAPAPSPPDAPAAPAPPPDEAAAAEPQRAGVLGRLGRGLRRILPGGRA